MDGWTDGRTDHVVTIGHPHFSMPGPKKYLSECNIRERNVNKRAMMALESLT